MPLMLTELLWRWRHEQRAAVQLKHTSPCSGRTCQRSATEDGLASREILSYIAPAMEDLSETYTPSGAIFRMYHAKQAGVAPHLCSQETP